MNSNDNGNSNGGSGDAPKPRTAPSPLRLIKSEPQKVATDTAKKARKTNPFVNFMTAYADAIDREIDAILDL
jgi:hypothetical protein